MLVRQASVARSASAASLPRPGALAMPSSTGRPPPATTTSLHASTASVHRASPLSAEMACSSSVGAVGWQVRRRPGGARSVRVSQSQPATAVQLSPMLGACWPAGHPGRHACVHPVSGAVRWLHRHGRRLDSSLDRGRLETRRHSRRGTRLFTNGAFQKQHIGPPALAVAAASRVRMSASCLRRGCASRTCQPRHAVCMHSAAAWLRCRWRRTSQPRAMAWMATTAACLRANSRRHQACSTGAARRARRNQARALKVPAQGAMTASAAASRSACCRRRSCCSASKRRYSHRPLWPRYAACTVCSQVEAPCSLCARTGQKNPDNHCGTDAPSQTARSTGPPPKAPHLDAQG